MRSRSSLLLLLALAARAVALPPPLEESPDLAEALGLDPETSLSFSLENLSLTRLDHIESGDDSGIWRIVCVNRTFG